MNKMFMRMAHYYHLLRSGVDHERTTAVDWLVYTDSAQGSSITIEQEIRRNCF